MRVDIERAGNWSPAMVNVRVGVFNEADFVLTQELGGRGL